MAIIAVVDDSRLARTFASGALVMAGHQVAEVEPTDLAAVLEELRSLRPDLLLLDHVMPAFPGPKLVRACYEDSRLSQVKVVMLTAHHEHELEQRMERLGVHAIVHKPVSPRQLVEAVAQALAIETL